VADDPDTPLPTEPIWSAWFDEPQYVPHWSSAILLMVEYEDGYYDDEVTQWRADYPIATGDGWLVPTQYQVFSIPAPESPTPEGDRSVTLHASPYAYIQGSPSGGFFRRDYRAWSVGTEFQVTFISAAFGDGPHTTPTPDASVAKWMWQCRDVTDTGAVSDWSYPVLALTTF
jgi:hypothetical protein